MNVPADALHALAVASGASVSLRAEGVVRWATARLAEQDKALRPVAGHEQLRTAAERALRALTDPEDHPVPRGRRAAARGTERNDMKQTVSLWAIENQHPRSTSINPNTFARTRKKAEALSLKIYTDAAGDDVDRFRMWWLRWHEMRRNKELRAVRVEVTWGEP